MVFPTRWIGSESMLSLRSFPPQRSECERDLTEVVGHAAVRLLAHRFFLASKASECAAGTWSFDAAGAAPIVELMSTANDDEQGALEADSPTPRVHSLSTPVRLGSDA
jgi:hypothetical protein